LASNEIFSPSNKIHREVGRAKDLSAPLYNAKAWTYSFTHSWSWQWTEFFSHFDVPANPIGVVEAAITHWSGGTAGPKPSLDILETIKISCL
jgi:hypothetical protein